jgi:hypothetical protein
VEEFGRFTTFSDDFGESGISLCLLLTGEELGNILCSSDDGGEAGRLVLFCSGVEDVFKMQFFSCTGSISGSEVLLQLTKQDNTFVLPPETVPNSPFD